MASLFRTLIIYCFRVRLACRSWWLLTALYPLWKSMSCVEEVFAPAFAATRALLDVDVAAVPAFVRRAGEAFLALGTADAQRPRAPLTWVLARPKMLPMVEPRFDELCAQLLFDLLVMIFFTIVL